MVYNLFHIIVNLLSVEPKSNFPIELTYSAQLTGITLLVFVRFLTVVIKMLNEL